MIFRISAAAELGRPALAETASDSFAVPVLSLRSTGMPEILKLHWLKSTLAAKTNRGSFIHTLLATDLFCSGAHVRILRGQGCPAIQDPTERKILAERRFSTLGKIERCAEEQDKAGALGRLLYCGCGIFPYNRNNDLRPFPTRSNRLHK